MHQEPPAVPSGHTNLGHLVDGPVHNHSSLAGEADNHERHGGGVTGGVEQITQPTAGGRRHSLNRIVAAEEDEARRIGPGVGCERGDEDGPADSLPDVGAHISDEFGVTVVEQSLATMDDDTTPHRLAIEKGRPQLVSLSIAVRFEHADEAGASLGTACCGLAENSHRVDGTGQVGELVHVILEELVGCQLHQVIALDLPG